MVGKRVMKNNCGPLTWHFFRRSPPTSKCEIRVGVVWVLKDFFSREKRLEKWLEILQTIFQADPISKKIKDFLALLVHS